MRGWMDGWMGWVGFGGFFFIGTLDSDSGRRGFVVVHCGTVVLTVRIRVTRVDDLFPWQHFIYYY